MGLMKSRFLKKWCFITLNGTEGYFKAFVEKVGMEADQPAYHVRYDDGRRETIFLSSVFRIWLEKQGKAKLIPLKIDNKLRLVR